MLLKVVYHSSQGSFWVDFETFEILGGAGDIYKSISTYIVLTK